MKKILTTKSLVICHLRPFGKTFFDYLASASIHETMGSNKVLVEDLFQLMIRCVKKSETISSTSASNIFWIVLSSKFSARQAQREVVKIKNLDFSYWAWSTPWGHVLSLKTFCRNPALSWAIRYSVFQKVNFTSSFEFVCGNPFSTFWHLMVKFG